MSQKQIYDLEKILDTLEALIVIDKVEEHVEKEDYDAAVRLLKSHGRLKYWVVDDEEEDYPPRDWYGYA